MLLYSLLGITIVQAQEHLYDHVFFSNSRMKDDYFFSRTTYSYPSFVTNKNLRLPVSGTIFHTPGNALQLEYVNKQGGNWRVAVFKQELRGQDHFKPVKFLSFWLYIATTYTKDDNLPAIQFMKRDSSLSGRATIGVRSTNTWERVTIPVDFFAGADISDPTPVIAVVFSQNDFIRDDRKHAVYIDDIEFIPEIKKNASAKAIPAIRYAKGYARHTDIEWMPVTDTLVKYVKVYRSEGGGPFKPAGIQSPLLNRYADYTGAGNVSYSQPA